ELALDVAAFLDIDALDLAAGRAGLLGDQHLAEHLAGRRGDRVERLDDAHAALARGIALEVAGPAAAGMDLGFDDPDRAAEAFGDLLRLLRRVGDAATRHGDAE